MKNFKLLSIIIASFALIFLSEVCSPPGDPATGVPATEYSQSDETVDIAIVNEVRSGVDYFAQETIVYDSAPFPAGTPITCFTTAAAAAEIRNVLLPFVTRSIKAINVNNQFYNTCQRSATARRTVGVPATGVQAKSKTKKSIHHSAYYSGPSRRGTARS